MKNDLTWYINRAKKLNNIKSDRNLAIALGISTLLHWRKPDRPSVPSPSMIIRLADLAHIPHEVALLDRDIWEAKFKAPETVPVYESIKKALRGLPHIAAMLLVLIALSGSFITFDGGNSAFAGGKKGSASAQTIYIMEHFSRIRAFARSVLSIIYGFFTPALYLS